MTNTQHAKLSLQRRDDSQTVQKMMRQHVCWFPNRGQVVNLVPLLDQIQVRQQLIQLQLRQINGQRCSAIDQLIAGCLHQA